MNNSTYIMYVILFQTIVFVIYILMLSSRITSVERKFEILIESFLESESIQKDKFEATRGMIEVLNSEIKELEQKQQDNSSAL